MNFSLRSLRFKPALRPSLAALATVVLTGYLGHWQQERVAEKRGLQREFDTLGIQQPVMLDSRTRDPAMRYRRALAVGEWRGAGQVYVDNQVNRGTVGYHVVTPLKLHGTNTYVLVNRGWIARGASFPVPPPAAVSAGSVSISGYLSLPTGRFIELSPQSVEGVVWQNLTIERYRQATRLDVLPFVLIAGDARLPLERVTERPDARAEKNVEYMLTWYSLAATVIVLWIGLNTRRVGADSAGMRGGADNNGIDS